MGLNMKKRTKIISLFLLLTYLVTLTVNAENTQYAWYIKKNGSDTPNFPKETSIVKSNNGYYIDEIASQKGEKVIYLTFDAGYENGNVEKILNILSEEDIKGSFFILSNVIRKNTALVKRMFEEGHEVCNHTKNHKNLTNLTNEEIKNNLSELEKLCYDKTGYEMKKYFRFPEGRFDERTLCTVSDLGYKTFFWSLAYADWDNNHQMDEKKAMNNLLSNTHCGSVILLHPTSETNVKILPDLIKRWKEMGYSFGTLEELIEKNA